MHLCPKSAVGSNINGQPPSITVIPCCRPYSVAAGETLPLPLDRCIHTCLIPSSAHSRIVASAVSGSGPITTVRLDRRTYSPVLPQSRHHRPMVGRTMTPLRMRLTRTGVEIAARKLALRSSL
jgi:hypothetical protein